MLHVQASQHNGDVINNQHLRLNQSYRFGMLYFCYKTHKPNKRFTVEWALSCYCEMQTL